MRSSYAAQPPFRVLGYIDYFEWVALALDLDIRGFSGGTFCDALAELDDLVKAQIRACTDEGCPEDVEFPAEPQYFRMFHEAGVGSETRMGDYLVRMAAATAPAPNTSR